MSKRLPLIDPVTGDKELENVEAVLESGYMTQGPYAEEFENSIADLVGTDHGITATSNTTGMVAVLDALDIGPGDEVVVPDFTYPATANVVERVGAEPVLVDVKPDTFNVDPAAVRRAVTEETAALLPVSWAGQPLDPDPLRDIADDHDVPIVEDAACSLGAAYDGVHVGSQFDASIFSFHPRKAITTGEGGVVTLDDDDLAREVRTIKNFGMDQSGASDDFLRANATNYRLSDILAAVGVAQLERREEILDRRREIAHRYDDLFESIPDVHAPAVPDAAYHVYQNYCVYVEAGDDDTRDHLIEALDEEDVETQIGTFALHEMPAFENANRVGDLDVSRDLYHNLLGLPVAHWMDGDDQQRVVDAIDAALDSYR